MVGRAYFPEIPKKYLKSSLQCSYWEELPFSIYYEIFIYHAKAQRNTEVRNPRCISCNSKKKEDNSIDRTWRKVFFSFSVLIRRVFSFSFLLFIVFSLLLTYEGEIYLLTYLLNPISPAGEGGGGCTIYHNTGFSNITFFWLLIFIYFTHLCQISKKYLAQNPQVTGHCSKQPINVRSKQC